MAFAAVVVDISNCNWAAGFRLAAMPDDDADSGAAESSTMHFELELLVDRLDANDDGDDEAGCRCCMSAVLWLFATGTHVNGLYARDTFNTAFLNPERTSF